MSFPFTPGDHREAIAHHRLAVIGSVVNRELDHGELIEELRRLSAQRYREPAAAVTRTYGVSTLQRWLYAFKAGGIDALKPALRSDRGPGQKLNPELRELLLDIRRENPTVQTPLVIATLVDDGRLKPGAVSEATLNRLYRSEGLDRRTLRTLGKRQRLRWEAEKPGIFWHADVCHGPTIIVDGVEKKLRIHAILDDNARYIIAIWAYFTEQEVDMLDLLLRALRRVPAPEVLYLDNGSTYRGEQLRTICSRLGVNLLHAQPYDPQARGKMERFWRTLREQLLNHLGALTSLHDVNVRLWAYVDTRYHKRPHAGLLGRSPEQRWALAARGAVSEARLREAYTVRERRRVRRDSTLSIKGEVYELDQSFLAGRLVSVVYTPVVSDEMPVVEHDGHRYPLTPVDPTANARRGRKNQPHVPTERTRAFDPAQSALDRASGKSPSNKRNRR